MSSPLITIGEWGGVADAIAMMNQRGVSQLPIVSANGYLVSLITLDDAQHLRGRGVSALNEFVRTSVIVPMVRRRAWKRMVHRVRKQIRENELWWFLAVGLALAGAVLALAMSWSWRGFQTYQPKDYEPKDLPRQQYEEQKEKSKTVRIQARPHVSYPVHYPSSRSRNELPADFRENVNWPFELLVRVHRRQLHLTAVPVPRARNRARRALRCNRQDPPHL